MLEQGLFEWAASQSSITALLGSNPLRFYKLLAPPATRQPATTYQRAGIARSRTLCGTIKLAFATVQVDHYGKTWEEAAGVAEAFRLALTDFAGMMGEVEVKESTLENEFDLDDPEPGLFRRSQSWSFWFVE